MARPEQLPNMAAFDAYFQQADLDKDGRISGSEAVGFFQGSNLPKHILAQIWMHADQNRTGFLSRLEFFNALKLVTVAQGGHELTPDIVKSALFGPAAGKIPPPRINPVASPMPQMNTAVPPVPGLNASVASRPVNTVRAPMPAVNAMLATTVQSPSFRGPQPLPNTGLNQQYGAAFSGQVLRPLTGQTFPLPMQGLNQVPGPGAGVSTAALQVPNSNISVGLGPQVVNRGLAAPVASMDAFAQGSSAPLPSVTPRSIQDAALSSIQSLAKDSKPVAASANGFSSGSIFGEDAFSAFPSQPKKDSAPLDAMSFNNLSDSTAIVPVSSSPAQASSSLSQIDALQTSLSKDLVVTQIQQTPSVAKPVQLDAARGTSILSASGVLVGPAASGPAQTQAPWPKMTPANIQRYNAIFVEVDTDRDGKITGDQARNLFMSWRLPREVLKQIWDLSDQDNDSMLSIKEFCIALYMMERYREGRPLPPALPNSLMFDEALLAVSTQQTGNFGTPGWQASPGFPQQMVPRGRSAMPVAGVRPPGHGPIPGPNDVPGARPPQPQQPKSKVPILEKHFVNQLSRDEQDALNSKYKEASESENKVEELEKEILDSREKIEFYRTKMQELVLYKSRCDNRLNEITERASADRREAEVLMKKYEEKYKQVGDLSSKLTMEEATFRDIQERKMEIYNAIAKMEEGGSADGILQVRADRIQSDLEELVKALNERCKRYGLRAKPITLVELPYGWQPGIQEGAAQWDEDWDKFEDEGFSIVQELSMEGETEVRSEKLQPSTTQKSIPNGELASVSSSDHDTSVEKSPNTTHHFPDNGSAHAHSEGEDESAKSGHMSPLVQSRAGSPPQEVFSPQFDKASTYDGFGSSKDVFSDHGGEASSTFGYDEPVWSFNDANDDVDSVWGFNSKDSEHEKSHTDSFFGSDDMGLNPIRTSSPGGNSLFGKEKSPFSSFMDSPQFNANSPAKYSETSEDHGFGNAFAKFDSFSIQDGGFSPRDNATLARFDSIRSTSDRSHGFMSFDDADPFGTGPFKSDNSSTSKRTDDWRAF